jgi:hypothetical protein
MNTFLPNPDCPLNCAYGSGPMCVCNLVAISGQYSRISLGLRMGLNHVYENAGMPPCLHGEKGSTYWSNKSRRSQDGVVAADS